MGKSETELKILDAARSEFLTCGFEGTRMRSIAERADINKGLLHYYFKSKDALLVRVFEETFGELFQTLAKAFHDETDLFRQIEVTVTAYTEFMLRHPHLPRFIISELNRDSKSHIKRMKQAGMHSPLIHFMESIEAAKKKGQIRNDICAEQLILNMISLVLFPVVAKEMVKFMHNRTESSYKELMHERKKVVSDFIIQSIRKK